MRVVCQLFNSTFSIFDKTQSEGINEGNNEPFFRAEAYDGKCFHKFVSNWFPLAKKAINKPEDRHEIEDRFTQGLFN